MYQNEITELPKLRNDNYENIFTVNTDENGQYFYNLLQSVIIPSSLPANYYVNYDIEYGDTWPYIAYKAYNNPNLWWVIVNVNNINDPTSNPVPGTRIKVLKIETIKEILNQINTH